MEFTLYAPKTKISYMEIKQTKQTTQTKKIKRNMKKYPSIHSIVHNIYKIQTNVQQFIGHSYKLFDDATFGIDRRMDSWIDGWMVNPLNV